MNKKKIAFGIGILLAVLAVLTVPAVADNVFYLVPRDSEGAPGEEISVSVMLNASDVTDAFDAEIWFDLDVVNITAWENPETGFWMWWDVGHHGNYIHAGGMNFAGGKSGLIGLANLTLKGNNSGISQLHFDPTYTGCGFQGNPLPETLIDGTFTCIGPAETFKKELVTGWNLISLPLNNETDMTVANIINKSLGGKYDALYKYNASAHNFVPLSSSDTMENGVGYFIHITSTGTWTYKGTPYNEMNIPLKEGLNMVGWLNCNKTISDGLSSITGNYYYVASWNASAALPSFETFNPVAPDGFNDFDEMERGTGYFISAKESCWLNVSC